MSQAYRGTQYTEPALFECFADGCHWTWIERAEACYPCPVCGAINVMKYDNKRTAALEAAGIE